MKTLWFDMIDLSGISPELLLGAIKTLEEIKLFPNTTLNAEQVNAILRMVVEARHGKLNKIIVHSNIRDGSVCPELLQTANQAVQDLLEIDLWEGYVEEEEDSEEF